MPRGQTLHQEAQCCCIGDFDGYVVHGRRVDQRLLGIATTVTGGKPADAPPVRQEADDLHARNHRQRLSGQVGVLGGVGVRVIDAGRADVEEG